MKIFITFLYLVLLSINAHTEPHSKKKWQPPIQKMNCGNNKPYKVHLTFDDGPVYPQTLQILKTLKKHKTKGTFFISLEKFKFLQTKDEKDYTQDEIRQLRMVWKISKQGHTLANHSFDHIDHTSTRNHRSQKTQSSLTDSYRTWKQLTNLPWMRGTNKHLKKVRLDRQYTTQLKPPFRFPYGNGWHAQRGPKKQRIKNYVMKSVKKNGFQPVHWEIDSWDWNKHRRHQLPRTLLDQVCAHKGGVALFHDEHSAPLLDSLLTSIKKSGHQVVDYPEIYKDSLNTPSGRLSFRETAYSGMSCGGSWRSGFSQTWSNCNEFHQNKHGMVRRRTSTPTNTKSFSLFRR